MRGLEVSMCCVDKMEIEDQFSLMRLCKSESTVVCVLHEESEHQKTASFDKSVTTLLANHLYSVRHSLNLLNLPN